MLSQLKTYIQQIINTGITDNTPWSLASRVQLTNSLLVIVVPFVSFSAIINLFQRDALGLLVCLIWTILASVIVIQNKRGKYYFNFFYIVVLLTLMTDIVLLLIGRTGDVSPMYTVAILMTLFFFKKTKYIIPLIIYIVTNYFLAFYILDNYDTVLRVPSPAETNIYFFASLLIMVTITLRVLNENQKRIRETEKLLREVEMKNKELERFAYITSHDLKEPLRSIASFSGLLERKLTNNQDKETQEYLSFIKASAIQLNTLMDSVLDFVNTSNSKEHQVSDLELSLILRKATQNITEKLKEKNVKIKSINSMKFKGVESQFVILFQHLIENGIKFNKDKTPKITIDVEKTPLAYIFSIEDNGIGIEECYHKKVFIPFKKLHNKSDYKGAGIGLSICQRIVEQHDGYFWVESEIDRGSTFYFSIPIKENKQLVYPDLLTNLNK